jgi:surface protein
MKAAIAVDRVSFTDTSCMFLYCESLTTLDVSNFDTSNVTNMSWMFSDCSSLTTLDLSNFDTSNVIRMGYMFDQCSDLTLDCSHWNVDKVVYYDRFKRDAPKVIPPVWKN